MKNIRVTINCINEIRSLLKEDTRRQKMIVSSKVSKAMIAKSTISSREVQTFFKLWLLPLCKKGFISHLLAFTEVVSSEK